MWAKVFKRKCYDSLGVFDKFPSSYHETVKNKIIPQVNNSMMIMLKGIILLESAYYKTIQQRQLFKHYKNIEKLCKFTLTFWEKNTSFNKISDTMKKLFNKYKTSVDNKLKDNYCWADESYMHPDPKDDGGLKYWHFLKEFKNYITVGEPYEKPEYIYTPYLCNMLLSNFQFGKKNGTVKFFEKNSWVGYYKSKDTPRSGEPPKMMVPSLRDLVKAGSPTPELSNLSVRIKHDIIPQLKKFLITKIVSCFLNKSTN